MNGKTQRSLLVVATLTGFGLLAACNPPASDQHLQEQAAQATEQAKQGSKVALADAKVAAANAERAVNDVAAGVKQGLDNKTPATGGSRLDLNDASQADLASLPGITPAKAGQIIDHRPYTSSHDVVKAGILTERQFEEIAAQVTVR
jgi:DNA uptake protein ComE-like DNA-binding protein